MQGASSRRLVVYLYHTRSHTSYRQPFIPPPPWHNLTLPTLTSPHLPCIPLTLLPHIIYPVPPPEVTLT